MSASSPEQNVAPHPASLGARADDPSAVLDSVVEAASFSANLWLSYLFLLLYLLISVGGVRQQDLFLENPVKLPVFDVKMPIQGFFWLGPIIFVIIHAYILLHISLLAEKVGIFNRSLEAAYPGKNDQTKIRRQLPNNIFVHFLAGPPEARNGVFGALLTLIVWISMVIGPVSLLIFFQMQFLPFHDLFITMIQRFAVMADLALLWALWPTTVQAAMIGEKRRNTAPWSSAVMASVSIFSFILVFAIATFPGEWLNTLRNLPGIFQVRTYLVHDNVDLLNGKPTTIWTDRLVLVNFDAIDHTKFNSDAAFAAVQSTYSLRGRDLQQAVFVDDNLRQMDFSAANLEGARFDNSILRDAQFGCHDKDVDATPYDFSQRAKPDGPFQGTQVKDVPNQVCTNLDGAHFIHSDLRGADFKRAKLQYANFLLAQLEAANLNGANLNGADFIFAHLEGASLQRADLYRSSFFGAYLQGATLVYADIEGADLSSAILEGSFLDNADLSNADLNGARFLYTSLKSAKFDDAVFGASYFVGANLNAADLQDASIGQADFDYAMLDAVKPPQVQSAISHRSLTASGTQQKYEDSLAGEWKQLGCSAVGAPYVLKGLIAQMTTVNPFGTDSPELPELAAAFLSPDCKGNVGLSDAEKASLEMVMNQAVLQQ